jgi:hypothetical protein
MKIGAFDSIIGLEFCCLNAGRGIFVLDIGLNNMFDMLLGSHICIHGIMGLYGVYNF